jgi:hypothetical protein
MSGHCLICKNHPCVCADIIKYEADKKGRKDDNDKIRMDLLPFESLEAVAKVLTFGAKKYADNNWQKVDNAESRYTGALLRHLSKHLQGEKIDAESGLSHLSHAATNVLFLVWFEEEKKKNGEK